MAEPRPDRLLRFTTLAMVATDIGFIIYWALIIAGVFPAEVLFEEYDDPRVAAWNWSFLPLDIAASLTGLAAVRVMRRKLPAAPALLSFSLALTATAGGMAVVYFAQRGQFDPSGCCPTWPYCCSPCRSWSGWVAPATTPTAR